MSDIESQSANIPDILMPKPLQRAVDVNVETNLLDPVSHQYNSITGGTTRFVLPARGVLDSPNATINFEIVNGDQNANGTNGTTMFPNWSGGLGCFRRVTARCGGNIISQVDQAGLYATIKTGFSSQAFRANVLDVHHSSSNQVHVRTINNQPIDGGDAIGGFVDPTTVRGFSQISNPTIDQDNFYGAQVEANNAGNVVHVPQTNKLLRDFNTAGQGPMVAVKLANLFPIFQEFQMPLFQMAQIEITIEWNPSVAAATTYANVADNIVIPSTLTGLGAGAAGFNASFGAPPFMSLDYLHYNDQEKQAIVDKINSTGMAMNFREVVHVTGVNPAAGAVAPGVATTSSHLMGMAGKEVQNIYVVKIPNVATTPNQLINGQIYNRNLITNQFKSQAGRSETYNVFVNNNKIYNRDVANKALAYQYLSQTEGPWNCLPLEYDNMNYDVDLNMVLCNSSVAGAPNLAVDTNGISGRFLSGTKDVIGIPFLKQPALRSARGNGERIGSAPIQFDYTTTKITGQNDMATNLHFFIEYRKALVITPFGVSTTDQ